MANRQYDISRVESDTLPVSFQGGTLAEIRGRNLVSSTYRVIEDGRAGYYSTNTVSDEKALRIAAENARYGKEINIDLPEPEPLKRVNIFSQKTADFSTTEMVDWGKRIIDEICKRIGKKLPIEVEIEKEVSRYTLENSKGVAYEHSYSVISAFCWLMDAQEGDMHNVFEINYSWDVDKIDIDRMIDQTARLYGLGKETTGVKTSKIPVLLHPYAVTQFLEPFVVGINGEGIKDGSSPLKGRLEEGIFGDKVTIYDDPFWDESPGSAPFDAEGTPARERIIIEKGVLKSFNHSLETAAATAQEPTGGSSRSPGSKPYPGMYNLIMEPGCEDFEAILSSVDNGLYLRYLSGSGQANTMAGEFSMGIYSGYSINNGKLGKRLKNVMVTGNIYDVLKRVEGVSAERLKCFGQYPALLPYVLLDGVSVAG